MLEFQLNLDFAQELELARGNFIRTPRAPDKTRADWFNAA